MMRAAHRALVPPLTHAGIALARAEEEPVFALASDPALPQMTPDTPVRAASISKIVTGQTVWAVLAGHPGASDADAGEILGLALRHPSGAPVTPRQLLCHASGLWDEAGYRAVPGQTVGDWLAGLGPGIWSPDPPATIYRYCNLGYVLAAACAERLSGQRFDLLAQDHVLGPHGIEAGFNWAGLDAGARSRRLPCYRRDEAGRAIAQIDETVAGQGASGPVGEAVDLAALAPGQSALALSPQGGLRLSIANALRLARALPHMAQDRLWTAGSGDMDDPAGLVDAYGPGLMFHDRPGFYPRPLVGHFANAYGFCGGLWYDAARDAAFVIALNGLPVGDEADDLRPEERRLFDAVSQELGQ